MALISTLDQFIAGVQPPIYFAKPQITISNGGQPTSFWGIGPGIPGAGTFNSTLAGGTYSSSSALVPGQLPHTDPALGINSYLNRFTCGITPFTRFGALMLCDRLWDNGGISVTSSGAQTVNSPVWPARDANGTTNGLSVMLALEVQVATTGTGTPTITVGYTNSFGTAGRTGTSSDTLQTTSNVGYFYRINWHSGDAGVQSVQSITFGGTLWTGGTVNLVAYRVLAHIPNVSNQGTYSQDSVTGGLPRLYNGVVPFLVVNASGGCGLSGMYQEVQI